jgi:hypothetical protein
MALFVQMMIIMMGLDPIGSRRNDRFDAVRQDKLAKIGGIVGFVSPAFVIGKRTQSNADLRLKRLIHVTDDHIPFFTSDQLSAYRSALLKAYGIWHQPQR